MTTINGIVLLPCPYCGRNDVDVWDGDASYRVVCNDRECEGAGPHRPDRLSAIEAWNKRVTEPTPADDLAASVAGVADIPARREEDDLNKLDEA